MGITGEISILPLIENVRQMNPTKLIRSIFAKRLSQIDRYADYGDIIQQKTLLDLLQKAKNTEFGTKFKFNDISSYKSFAENIPINGYEELKPYIERTMSGEQNILWPTPIRHLQIIGNDQR